MKESNSVQALYTKRASLYERLFVDFLGWGKELRTFFRTSDYLQTNTKILDAGCGTGIITRVLVQLAEERGYQSIQFYAFDLTQSMLDVFQQWITEHGASNIKLHQANVLEPETLPSDWNEYDLIVSSTMIEYLPGDKAQEALANLKQLLKSGGKLIIIATRRNRVTRLLAEKWWKTRVYDEGELRSILHQIGFEQIQSKRFSSGWSGFIVIMECERT